MSPTDRVLIGSDAVVGGITVLDIDATSLGDGAQLGQSSSLHRGTFVPAGEHWHGTPVHRTDVDYTTVGTARHESYRKLTTPPVVSTMLKGTPFKNVVSRLQGVRLGRRVIDDGYVFAEKSPVHIAGPHRERHAQHGQSFRPSRSRTALSIPTAVGAGCTLGVGALVHYGVRRGDGACSPPTPCR